ncbi:Zn-finger in ubiquitin-hydrolases and other protein, putative [Angomonas deanei]|uniref:Zn-finger in ubiquitin-hydrolases and other protein, putative n=1 Tax=Angomonas deanei TaxID=59799 RepID=A0A7G2C5V8_9TRYP|nr:Zn-finger in ubiquitin-hydrolases and other protein, putative [Angomonas deanei]
MYKYYVERGDYVKDVEIPFHHYSLSGRCKSTDKETSYFNFRVGNFRFLRLRTQKGNNFEPYIPTTTVLLNFPACVSRYGGGDTLLPSAASKLGGFLEMIEANLQKEKEKKDTFTFSLDDAVICRQSGSILLIVSSQTVEGSLNILDTVNDIHNQTNDILMTPLFVNAVPCVPAFEMGTDPSEEKWTSVMEKMLDAYYHIPTCVLCCDRLEGRLTGKGNSVDASPLCMCALQNEEKCICIQYSRCNLCQKLHEYHREEAQSHGDATTSGCSTKVRCMDCGEGGDPWMCLICDYVGCSRYQAMHAKDHYQQYDHYFSINLQTQQIWDYDSDTFVHRLVLIIDATTGDATRVQLPEQDVLEGVEGADTRSPNRVPSTREADPVCCSNKTSRVGAYISRPVSKDGMDHLLSSSLYQFGTPFSVVDSVTASKFDKKLVSGKNETCLYSSHVQYALLLKSQLDDNRKEYEDSMHQNDVSGSPTVELFQDVYAGLTRFISESNSIYLSPSQEDAMFAQFAALQEELINVNKNTRAKRELEGVLHDLEQQLHTIVRDNVKCDMEQCHEINELKETLKEIKLNLVTERRLQQQMGKDASTGFVVMGGGKTRKKRA